MDAINQTNRTILFEEINPEKLDLLTIVGDVKGIDSLNDTMLKDINEKLLVKNFDEFLEKFSPTVYSFYNAATQKVAYTLKKPETIPEACISEVRLDQNNDFLKMLFTLIETKKSQGIINVDFKFEKVLDMISPKKVMEDIKQVRKEINYLYNKYEEMEEEDPSRLELGDKLNLKFEEASVNYNNVMAMLPLAIEDIKTRLLLGQSQEDKDTEAIKFGILTMGEDGELKILEASKQENNALAISNQTSSNNLIEVFEEDYEEITENPTKYVKDLVVRTFCPLPAVQTEINVEKEIENYNGYLEFYKEAKDEFVKTAKPLVEKILGIKMYFEQYDTKSKGMEPKLLITNTKLEMMLKSNNKPRLETYLNTVNAKNDFSNTIWFGIVPKIELDTTPKMQSRRERFKGTNKTQITEGNTIESLTLLLDMIKKYKIQVFFNFEANDETTFNDMATTGVEKYMDKTEKMLRQDYSEYAIPCLPNFTIIPKEKSGVVLDSKMKQSEKGGAMLSKEKEDVLKLWIEGVYLDAAYIAAGIVSAYQCPEYLKNRFKNVTRKYPGVRFDIEGGDNGLKVVTTMAKEITGYTNSIKDSINRNNFGFIFSSENAQIGGQTVKRITVYKARSLSLTEEGEFDSIYKTLMSTYVERMLRFQSTDFKQDKIIKFFSNNPNSQKSQWISDTGYINSIIQDGDDITHTIDLENNICQLDLVFNGNVKNLEVNITKSTSGGNK